MKACGVSRPATSGTLGFARRDPRPREASVADPALPTPARPSRRKIGEYVLSRLKRSWILRACAALAFLEYGGLVFLAVFGTALRPNLFKNGSGLNFSLAGWLALCSLGSWFFIFRWFPFLQTLEAQENGDGSALVMGRVLETFAIGCVLVVHVMLAVVLFAAV